MKKCRICKQEFNPCRPLQVVCSPICALQLSEQDRVKKYNKEQKAIRKQTKQELEKFKTRSEWIKQAQVAFNSYIRYRDKDQTCICCGKRLNDPAIGGGFDCGHYRSTGSAPHLRFTEANAHGQTKHCNRWRGGRAVDYRLGLIARIGLQAVEDLESDQTPRKWTISELQEIIRIYRDKLKGLKLLTVSE